MFSVVSLFTGAGGLDLGIEAAGEGGLDFRAWVESDPDCRATLALNRPHLSDSPCFFSDIETVMPHQLMEVARLKSGELFLLIGGPPCQAFSTAGLRGGLNTSAGRVVRQYFGMVEMLRPRFFVFENVRGLLSAALKHRPLTEREHPQEVPDDEEAQLGSVMSRVILPGFDKLGYECVYGILCAADYGTAQVRHRVFILGSRDREFRSTVFRKQTSRQMTALDLVPVTFHKFAPYPPIRPWRTLREAIGHLDNTAPAEAETYGYSTERGEVFRHIPPGRNWKWIRDNPALFPDGYLQTVMGGAIASGGGKEGFWRRLSWDEPAPTLTAQPQQLASSLCHPTRLRPLSIPEYAAIQDFPCTYRFAGSKSSKYRQIGNAVPLRLAEAVGRALLAVARRSSRDLPEGEHPSSPPQQRRRVSRNRRKLDQTALPVRDLFSLQGDG